MKNNRALLMMAVALIAAVLAVIYAARWLNQQNVLATEKVVMAAKSLELGQTIKREDLKVVDWPIGSVPDGAFEEIEQAIDRVPKAGILQNEPVLEYKLAPKGTKGGLSALIAKGKRAITVRVNDVIGVAGFALPGNYVDVIVSTENERSKGTNKDISKIVLEKILVLAAGVEASRDETKPKVVKAVTLEVFPHEAEKLDLARSVGQLSLVLRNQIDTSSVVTEGSTKDNLLGYREPVKVVRPIKRKKVRKKQCVEVYNGQSRSKQCF